MRLVRIGTRGSQLALAQAGRIKHRLESLYPRVEFRLVIIKTTGDEFQSVELFKKETIGVFTKAIEKKLIKKEIDIAVHSLKDLPTELPKGLTLAAFPKRLDVRDVLISKARFSLTALPKGARVGTGSIRRKRQILLERPDLKLVDIRGNLDTRVSKVLKENKLDAIVVARAGLLRLGKYLKYAAPISPWKIMPAVGQAALGIEIRSKDKEILKLVRPLNHRGTEIAVLAERHFLKILQGGCRVPIGIFSSSKDGKVRLKVSVFSVESAETVSGQIEGAEKNWRRLAEALGKRLLKKGAAKFLSAARRDGSAELFGGKEARKGLDNREG